MQISLAHSRNAGAVLSARFRPRARGLLFEVRVPNDVTLRTFAETDAGRSAPTQRRQVMVQALPCGGE